MRKIIGARTDFTVASAHIADFRIRKPGGCLNN